MTLVNPSSRRAADCKTAFGQTQNQRAREFPGFFYRIFRGRVAGNAYGESIALAEMVTETLEVPGSACGGAKSARSIAAPLISIGI